VSATSQSGDRVAFIFAAGSYATHTLVAAERVVPLPVGVGFGDAAAVLFQGLTAHYLATSTFALAPGMTCLVHSAAGGCGILLCQIAKIRGAEVIGAVSTPAKADIAREAGADHVVVYAAEDFAEAVKRITRGRGVDVVYDAVGLDTYIRSMNSLRARGTLALYGEASGLVPPIDPRELLFRKHLALPENPSKQAKTAGSDAAGVYLRVIRRGESPGKATTPAGLSGRLTRGHLCGPQRAQGSGPDGLK
jgi:NADPH2:quinone reductase